MKLLSIVTNAFNEQDNIEELYNRINQQTIINNKYDFEIIFVDNRSTDRTVDLIKNIAKLDSRVKLIVNSRNFGHIRSPIHGLYQANGLAIVAIASDLQDPPELISDFIHHWESGYLISIGIKTGSKESFPMRVIRKLYYYLSNVMSDIDLIPNFTGFGLYDRSVIDFIKRIEDPYPYFRGLIAELGIEYASVYFYKPDRIKGFTKNNFFTLFDMAMLGITSHSKLPIRLATIFGFLLSGLSFFISFVYIILKIVFWDQFNMGTAPILVGLFFFMSVQLFFIGLLGEYIASIHTKISRRPLVVERERFNMENGYWQPKHSEENLK